MVNSRVKRKNRTPTSSVVRSYKQAPRETSRQGVSTVPVEVGHKSINRDTCATTGLFRYFLPYRRRTCCSVYLAAGYALTRRASGTHSEKGTGHTSGHPAPHLRP